MPVPDDCRAILERTWGALLPPGSRCGLALYPDHWNVGDAAIWWATRRLLADLDVTVAYACDPWSYDPRALGASLPDGPILLLGGGNCGDVYPREHACRLRILADFPERRIIQLPQSIWFRTPAAIATMAEVTGRHRDFVLLVRDHASLDVARAQLPGVTAMPCPDSMLALGPLARLAPATVPVLALWRRDSESRGPLPALPAGWVARDWTLDGGPLPATEAAQLSLASRRFLDRVGAPPAWPPRPPAADEAARLSRRRIAWRHLPWLWDQLAEDRARRGLRILSQGRVVITDRLHAHLLCLLAGIPHVVCDTANGKVFAHRDAWLGRHGIRSASSAEEAVDMAASLLAALDAAGDRADEAAVSG